MSNLDQFMKYCDELTKLGDSMKRARPAILRFIIGTESELSITRNSLQQIESNVANEKLSDTAFRQYVKSVLEVKDELIAEAAKRGPEHQG